MDNLFQPGDSAVFDTARGSFRSSTSTIIPDSATVVSDTLEISADSTIMKAERVPLKPPQSLFTEHVLQAEYIKEAPFSATNEDWIAIHLIAVLFILAWIRLSFAKRLSQVVASFFTNRNQGMLSKEGNVLREQISLGLLVVYLVTTALFFYLVASRILITIDFGLQGFKLFSIILLSLLAIWMVKNIAITFVGHIFKNPVLLSHYVLTNFIFNVVMAIGLIPLIIVIVYVPSQLVLHISIILFVLGHLYRVIRQIFTALSYAKFSYLNRFLYLCTFEITPALVFIKLIFNKLVLVF